ncbi:MAG: DUF1674 domain-containing protein [Xanthomonadales bacterium]|nr:DUF1674 domain-containing protein [Xanthomonadales bacterium]
MHSAHESQSKPAEKPVAEIQPLKKLESEPKSEPESELGAKREIGGRKGLDPTRYGDWEKNGRCIDF